LETVRRFGALMTNNLPDDDSSSQEERFAEILEMLHPDFEIPVARSLPYGGDHKGIDGFLAMGGKFAETWNIIENPNPEFIDAGDDRVIALYTPTFESLATGRRVSFEMVEILTVRDGKIAKLVPYYFDTMELVETFSDKVAAAKG
jgi:ketosteroid isomerase-like protein